MNLDLLLWRIRLEHFRIEARSAAEKSAQFREDAVAMAERSRRELELCLTRTRSALRTQGSLPQDPYVQPLSSPFER